MLGIIVSRESWVLESPLAILNDVVFEDLQSLGVDLFLGKHISLFVHAHIDSDVSVQAEDDKRLVVLGQVLQVLVEMRH